MQKASSGIAPDYNRLYIGHGALLGSECPYFSEKLRRLLKMSDTLPTLEMKKSKKLTKETVENNAVVANQSPKKSSILPSSCLSCAAASSADESNHSKATSHVLFLTSNASKKTIPLLTIGL